MRRRRCNRRLRKNCCRRRVEEEEETARNPIAPPLKLFRQREADTPIRFYVPRVEISYRIPSVIAALCNGLDFGVAGDRRCGEPGPSSSLPALLHRIRDTDISGDGAWLIPFCPAGPESVLNYRDEPSSFASDKRGEAADGFHQPKRQAI